MTAIGYIRVSTTTQADGFGPAIQSHAIHARFPECRIFRDEGVSGKLAERPALAEALASLGENDVLVVARLDRLARDLMVQELLLREIRGRGADVVSCAEGEQAMLADDANDPSRKMIRRILGAVAEYDREMIVLRMRLGRETKKARGELVEGMAPWGMERDGQGGLKPNVREIAITQTMVALRDHGFSLDQIARELNYQKLWNRRGHPWTKQAVHRVLTGSSEYSKGGRPPREPEADDRASETDPLTA